MKWESIFLVSVGGSGGYGGQMGSEDMELVWWWVWWLPVVFCAVASNLVSIIALLERG